ncbi:MAG TPA: M48 family metallopeptidase [Chondromyces sp.]|nr:M48 family metallopeptidase [Chondromyces sp.]
MVRKWAFYAVAAFLLFGLFIYYYLFTLADGTVPAIYKGTSADPETFLNEKELLLSEEYSKVRNLLFFLSAPYEWLIYFLILIFGVSRAFEKWSEQTSRWSAVRTSVYVFYLSLLTFVLSFPLYYLSYNLSKRYEITVQSFPQWMKDQLIDFWLSFGMLTVVALILYALMKKFPKKWWLAAWGVFVPLAIFLMYIQLVLIDPLYNNFYPLKDKNLEAKILDLASQADIPAEHVYEVNMSEKTNSLNAYVTGVGDHSRIVLWDTTLERLSDKEILFIMAHEMAHYVEKHIYFGIAGYLLLALAGFWLAARWMERFLLKYGPQLNIHRISQLRTFPLLLLILSMLTFAASPVSNWVSRYQEMRADRYAIELTREKDPAIEAFQELTRAGLSQVNPPLLVKLFRYGHPTMLERINMIETYPITEQEIEK